jgi:Tol biopolymer transport system component/tRNA A-37 threonylcarbamoyl transferase component Bud32
VPTTDPTDAHTPAEFPFPFGRYVMLGILGEGGMARVFRAELRGPSEFRKPVAVKVVRSENADDRLRESLLREARIGGLLKHPNIVDIYDFGETGEQPWIAMELVEGTDLATWLEHFGPPPPAIVLELGIAVCSGLAEAHDLAEEGRPANLIHRDLKPSNVLLSRQGEVKGMDFGIAKAPGMVDGDTRTGMVKGTPRYLSPEQAQAKPLDRRSDVFALGLLLYELAIGEPFLDQSTVTAVIAALLKVDELTVVPSRLDALDECVPGLPSVVRRCLRRNPDERYPDARVVRRALEDLQAALGRSRHSLRGYVGPRAQQMWSSEQPAGPMPSLSSLGFRSTSGAPPRRGLLAAAAAVVLVVLVVLVALVVGGLWWMGSGGVDVPDAHPSAGVVSAEAPPRVRSRILVRGEEEVSDPSISPDGSQVVFVRRAEGGAELVLREVDGTGERVLSHESDHHVQPAISPDGTRMVFSRDRGLHVMALDGGEVRQITELGVHPDWSPDGTRVAYTTEIIHDPELLKTSRSALWVVDVESRRTHKVFEGDANMADWSPGGGRIAFWGAREDGARVVYTVTPEGEEPVAVTSGEAVDWNPRWAPDGRHLYFFSDRAGPSALWRVAIDEESGRTLGAPEPVTTGGVASLGFLSTDRSGRRWVYHASDSEQNIHLVPMVPLDGGSPGEPVRVTRGVRRLRSAALSPDGTQWAFAERTEQEDLYVMNADGTGQVRLTDDPHRDREVAWSPDGSRIAFYSDRDGAYHVWTIRPDGSDLRRVTPGEVAMFPIWAPDGNRLAVGDYAGGIASIVHLDAEGSPVRREQLLLPHLETGLYSPTSWSPDGQRIVLTRRANDVDSVVVYEVETGGYAPLGLPNCSSAAWLDDDTLLARQTSPRRRFIQIDWPDGAPVTRYEIPPDLQMWWWVPSPDGESLVFILNTDRTAIWVLDIE